MQFYIKIQFRRLFEKLFRAKLTIFSTQNQKDAKFKLNATAVKKFRE